MFFQVNPLRCFSNYTKREAKIQGIYFKKSYNIGKRNEMKTEYDLDIECLEKQKAEIEKRISVLRMEKLNTMERKEKEIWVGYRSELSKYDD